MATIRSTMFDIIKDLRRKVFDYQPESLDTDEYPPGDTIQFTIYFKDHAGIAADPLTSSIKITDSQNNIRVSSGTLTKDVVGTYLYYYSVPATCTPGDWTMQAEGDVATYASVKPDVFKVRSRHFVWTDEELQRVLDRHRVRYTRETITPDWNYLIYSTNGIKNLESATLYTMPDNSGSAISTSLYSADLNVGEFTFTIAQNTNIYPVSSEYPGYEYYMDGISHNIFASAEELLIELLADPSRASSWSRGSISQTGYKLTDLVREYRGKSGSGFQVAKLKRVYDS
jgi:hypothetical protein